MKKLGCSFAKPRAHRSLSEAGSGAGLKSRGAVEKAELVSEAESEDEGAERGTGEVEIPDFGPVPLLGIGVDRADELPAPEASPSPRPISEWLTFTWGHKTDLPPF